MLMQSKLIEQNDNVRWHPFFYAELIGHRLVYDYEDSDSIRYTQTLIPDLNLGVNIPYRRIPIRMMQDSMNENERLILEILLPHYLQKKPTIFIAFAGTHSRDTLIANAEIAAGEESFRQNEEAILANIMGVLIHYIKKNEKAWSGTPTEYKISITGHSLGAALAQLLFHSFQRVLAFKLKLENSEQIEFNFIRDNQEEYLSFKKKSPVQPIENMLSLRPLIDDISLEWFKQLEISVWNSTGVLKSVDISSNHYSRALVDCQIPQTAHIGMVDGDPIQVTGPGAILSDVGNNGAFIALLKVKTFTPRASTQMTTTLSMPVMTGVMASYMAGGIAFPVMAAFSTFLFSTGYFFRQGWYNHSKLHFDALGNLLPGVEAEYYESSEPLHQERIKKNWGNKSDFCNHAIRPWLINFGSPPPAIQLEQKMDALTLKTPEPQ